MSPRPRPKAADFPDREEMPEGEEHTRWVASPVKAATEDNWELPTYDPTESRSRRRGNSGNRVQKANLGRKSATSDITGSVQTPRKRAATTKRATTSPRRADKAARKVEKKVPTPAPAPRRRRRDPTPEEPPAAARPSPTASALPTPAPAPRRRSEGRMPTPEPMPARASRVPAPEPAPPAQRQPSPEPPARRSEPASPVASVLPAPAPPKARMPTPEPMPARRTREVPTASRPPTPAPAPPRKDPVASHAPPPPVPVPGGLVTPQPMPSRMPGPAAMPMDAPTVVRPDLVALAEADFGAVTQPAGQTFPSNWDEAGDEGDPTVALTAPANGASNAADASASPVQSLPGSASYSPPTPAPAKRAEAPEPAAPVEPTRSSRGVAPPPRSGDRPRKRGLPKGAQISTDESEGIKPLHVVYGALGVAGVLLVLASFVAGIIILMYMP